MAGIFLLQIPTAEYEASLLERQKNVLENDPPQLQIPQSIPYSENNNSKDERAPFVNVIEKLLEDMDITHATFIPTSNKRFYKVTFWCPNQIVIENIWNYLQTYGVGRYMDTSMSVMPCSITRKSPYVLRKRLTVSDVCLTFSKPTLSRERYSENKSPLKMITSSIRSRLTTTQVMNNIRDGSHITFDFLMYLLFAGLIAVVGLMDSNSVTIIASMLLCPMMGPIMALTFGITIHDRSLTAAGMKNVILAVFLDVAIGFIAGMIFFTWEDAWERGPWPTNEMRNNGQLRGLWVGALVALPSGGAVAACLLGGHSAILIGVAVATSLLPPAANAGLMWADSLLLELKSISENVSSVTYTLTNSTLCNKPALLPTELEYENMMYSYNLCYEFLAMGSVSLALTFVNVICIVAAAVAVLKVKGFPIVGTPEIPQRRNETEQTRSNDSTDTMVKRKLSTFILPELKVIEEE